MRLFTQDQFDQLCGNGRPGHHGQDWPPVVKLILPGTGCTWLLSEIVHSNYKLYGYGLADYGYGSTHDGYIDLASLELMSDPLQIHPVQQDKSFVAHYGISVYLTAARMNGGITNEEEALLEALDFMHPTADEAARQRHIQAPQLQP